MGVVKKNHKLSEIKEPAAILVLQPGRVGSGCNTRSIVGLNLDALFGFSVIHSAFKPFPIGF